MIRDIIRSTLESMFSAIRATHYMATRLLKGIFDKKTPETEVMSVIIANGTYHDVESVSGLLSQFGFEIRVVDARDCKMEIEKSDIPILILYFIHDDVRLLEYVMKETERASVNGKCGYLIFVIETRDKMQTLPVDVHKDIYRISGLVLSADSPSFKATLEGFIGAVASDALHFLRDQRSADSS